MRTGPEYIQSAEKRAFDIGGALVVGLATAPLNGAVLAGAAVDVRELLPVLSQERVGRHSMPLTVYKFRTIRRVFEINADAQTYGTFDHRASKFGQVMRRAGFDELPQLYNVLRGTMSLVNPRPLLQVDIEKYERADKYLFDDWLTYRSLCRPGLVSTSSVHRHSAAVLSPEIMCESMRMDIKDITKASLLRDIAMLTCAPWNMLQANLRANIEFPAVESS